MVRTPANMQGRLIAVVGPSGVGKDCVMEALAARDRFYLVRRVITRPSDAGGERFDSCDVAAFDRGLEAGRFALHWAAHDLRYGIPKTELACLARGRDALVNMSRKALSTARGAYPNLVVVHLTARPELRAKRLAARGRENAAGIARRLARKVALPVGLNVIEVANEGALEDTVQTILTALAVQVPLIAPSDLSRDLSGDLPGDLPVPPDPLS